MLTRISGILEPPSDTFMLLCVVVILVVFIFLLLLYRPYMLDKRRKDTVRKNGIMHFTKLNFAEKIMQKRYLKQGMTCKKVYFFTNDPVSRNVFEHNVLKHHKNNSLCKIVVKNLSENQLKRLRVRLEDNVLEHKGDFCFEPQNVLHVEDVDSACYSLGLKSVRFTLMRLVLWFLLGILLVGFIIFFIFVISVLIT